MYAHPHNKPLVERLPGARVDDAGQLAQLGAIVQHVQKVLPRQIRYTWEQRDDCSMYKLSIMWYN